MQPHSSKTILSNANVEALAQIETPLTGTCCHENGSICVVGALSFGDYYYQPEGPCKKY